MLVVGRVQCHQLGAAREKCDKATRRIAIGCDARYPLAPLGYVTRRQEAQEPASKEEANLEF